MTNRGKTLFCRKCEGHGERAYLRGHAAICPYQECECKSCKRLVQMRKTAFIRRYRSILTEDGDETEETQNSKQQKHQQRKQIRIDKMNPRFRIQIVRQDLAKSPRRLDSTSSTDELWSGAASTSGSDGCGGRTMSMQSDDSVATIGKSFRSASASMDDSDPHLVLPPPPDEDEGTPIEPREVEDAQRLPDEPATCMDSNLLSALHNEIPSETTITPSAPTTTVDLSSSSILPELLLVIAPLKLETNPPVTMLNMTDSQMNTTSASFSSPQHQQQLHQAPIYSTQTSSPFQNGMISGCDSGGGNSQYFNGQFAAFSAAMAAAAAAAAAANGGGNTETTITPIFDHNNANNSGSTATAAQQQYHQYMQLLQKQQHQAQMSAQYPPNTTVAVISTAEKTSPDANTVLMNPFSDGEMIKMLQKNATAQQPYAGVLNSSNTALCNHLQESTLPNKLKPMTMMMTNHNDGASVSTPTQVPAFGAKRQYNAALNHLHHPTAVKRPILMNDSTAAIATTAATTRTKYSPAALGAAAAVIVAAQKQQQRQTICSEENAADNSDVDVSIDNNFMGSFQQSFFAQADTATASRAITNPTPPSPFIGVSLPPRIPSASAMHSPNSTNNNTSPFLKSFSTPPMPVAQYHHNNHIMQQQQQQQFCQPTAIRQFLQNQRQQKQLQQIQQQPQNGGGSGSECPQHNCQQAQGDNNLAKQTNKTNFKQQQQQQKPKNRITPKQQQKVQMALRTVSVQQHQQQQRQSAVMQQQFPNHQQHDMHQQFLQAQHQQQHNYLQQQQQLPFNHMAGCVDYFSNVLNHSPQQQVNDYASLLTQSQPHFYGGMLNSSSNTSAVGPPLNVNVSSSAPLMYATAVTETQNAIATTTAATPTTTFDVTAFMQSVSNSMAQQKQQQSFACTSSSDYVNKQQRNQKQQRQPLQKNITVMQHQQHYSKTVVDPSGLASLLAADSTPPPLVNSIFPSESIVNGSSVLAKLVLSTTSSLIATTQSTTTVTSTLTANADSGDNLQEFWSSLRTQHQQQQFIMNQQPLTSTVKNNETTVKKGNGNTSNDELIVVSDEESKNTASSVSTSSFSEADSKNDKNKVLPEKIAVGTTMESEPKDLPKNNVEYNEFFALMRTEGTNQLNSSTVAMCSADKYKSSYPSALSAGMALIEEEDLRKDNANTDCGA